MRVELVDGVDVANIVRYNPNNPQGMSPGDLDAAPRQPPQTDLGVWREVSLESYLCMHNYKRTVTCSALTEGRSTVRFCAVCLLWNPHHYEDIRLRLATCNTNEVKAYTSSFAKLLCVRYKTVKEVVCLYTRFQDIVYSATEPQPHIN